MPDEIRDAVEKFEHEELEKQRQSTQDAATTAEEEARKAEHEMSLEVERIKGEVQAMVKRKADERVPIGEAVLTKKARVEEDSESDDYEEEWQREAAAQLAAEAEAEKIRLEELEQERKAADEELQRLQAAQINMPERVDLSLEEAKALFKVSVSPNFYFPNFECVVITGSIERQGHKSAASVGYLSTFLRE